MHEVENPIISDRHPIKDPQRNDAPECCFACKRSLRRYAVSYDGDLYCDEDCLAETLLDNCEYEEVRV